MLFRALALYGNYTLLWLQHPKFDLMLYSVTNHRSNWDHFLRVPSSSRAAARFRPRCPNDRLRDPTPSQTSLASQNITRRDMKLEPARAIPIEIRRVIESTIQYIRVEFEEVRCDVDQPGIFGGEGVGCDGWATVVVEYIVRRTLREGYHLVGVDCDGELLRWGGVIPDGSGFEGTSHDNGDEFFVGYQQDFQER